MARLHVGEVIWQIRAVRPYKPDVAILYGNHDIHVCALKDKAGNQASQFDDERLNVGLIGCVRHELGASLPVSRPQEKRY